MDGWLETDGSNDVEGSCDGLVDKLGWIDNDGIELGCALVEGDCDEEGRVEGIEENEGSSEGTSLGLREMEGLSDGLDDDDGLDELDGLDDDNV